MALPQLHIPKMHFTNLSIQDMATPLCLHTKAVLFLSIKALFAAGKGGCFYWELEELSDYRQSQGAYAGVENALL